MNNRAAVPGAAFAENITLSLKGVFPPDQTINVTFRGCGAQFRTEIVTSTVKIAESEIPVIVSLDFLVVEDDGRYIVTYTIGNRRPIPTSTVIGGGDKTTRNVSIGFQDMDLSGSVKCTSGEPVEIFKLDDKVLSLTVATP